LEYDDGTVRLRYFGLTLPLNPRQLVLLLRHDIERLEADLGESSTELAEFQSVLFHLDHLPHYTETEAALVADRRREKDIARQRLGDLVERSPRIRAHIDANIERFNGTPGDSPSFDLLHGLLEAQAYRLSSWRTATHEINYRRFFDVNELAAVRMEDPEVFAEAHRLLADLIARGAVSGVRVDHTDGLFDPASYLRQLAAIGPAPGCLYIVIEKILAEGEPLPATWCTHGTTGYDFLNDLNGLFVDGARARELLRFYGRFTGRTRTYADEVYTSKRLIITTSMASELKVLGHELNRLSEGDRRCRDFTLDSLRAALREVVACFPVYRTFVSRDGWTALDRHSVETAVSEALARNPAMEPSIFEFIRSVLLPTAEPGGADYEHRVLFAMKFQQYTGPVQAKGVEDTAFYRYAPLASLNEVGGTPARVGRSPREFHEANQRRLEAWPLTMLATSTHDTKRGEDARARINVLSEIPEQWRVAVSRWARANASARGEARGAPAPDRADEYLFYQALVGTWPPGLAGRPDRAYVDRIAAYMLKAVREAKVHTSWVNPSEAYDRAVAQFVERALGGRNARTFIPLFVPFQERIARLGVINSLAQVVLKIAAPGVPDFYQGAELWDLTLVDPDNRRPVDFALREAQLRELEGVLDERGPAAGRMAAVSDMLLHWEDGRVKLYFTAAGLRLRRRCPDLFLAGSYQPLEAAGSRAAHVVAFARDHGGQRAIAVAPRLVAGLFGSHASADAWGDTTLALPDGFEGASYTNVLTGARVAARDAGGRRTLAIAEALGPAPAAILFAERTEGSQR
ncbi:MAG: malto-oligosyltrehalose synthase, partial [Rhodospirillaceae bacterium]